METVTVDGDGDGVGVGFGVGVGAGVGAVGIVADPELLPEPPQLQTARVAATIDVSASDDRMPIRRASAIPLKSHRFLRMVAVAPYRRRNGLRIVVLTLF